MPLSYKNKPISGLRFQLVLDAENVVISTTSRGKIRANITGLEADQIEKLIDCIADAGPEAVEQFTRLMNEKLVRPAGSMAKI